MWRMFLASQGLPYSFTVCAPAVSNPGGNWTCGYISSFMLHLTLRGATGQTLSSMLRRYRLIGATVDGLHGQNAAATLPTDTQLPVMDWLALGATPQLAFNTVRALITGSCVHELGYAEPALGQNDRLYMSVQGKILEWLEQAGHGNLEAFRQSRFGGVVPMVILAIDRELPACFRRSIRRDPIFDNAVFVEQPMLDLARHYIPPADKMAGNRVLGAWIARTGSEEAGRIFLTRSYVDVTRVDGDIIVLD